MKIPKKTLRKSAFTTCMFLTFFVLLFLIQYFESQSEKGSIKTLFDAFWYAIVTLTTVGYGDLYPVTVPGKIIGLVIILFSLGLLSYVISQLSQYLFTYMEKKKLGFFGTKFTNHVILIGWSNVAKMMIEQITHANQKVVVLTDNRNHLDLIHDSFDEELVFAVFGDLNSEEGLKRANVSQASSILIDMEQDADALIYLINFRKRYEHVSTVIFLHNHELKQTFYNAGATYVVSEMEISTKLIASFVFEPDVAKFTEDIMSTAHGDHDFDMLEFLVNRDNPYCNQPYMDTFIDMKKSFNAILIGLARPDGDQYKLIKNPENDLPILEGDYILLVADGLHKKQIEEAFGVAEGRMVCA